MSHALHVHMDPTNPRWEHSEQRRQRSATFWKIMVGAAAGAALSTVIVASCLDRGDARRDRDRDQQEPAVVETTAMSTPTAYAPGASPAAAPAAPAVVGPSTSDSTGGIQATDGTTTAPVATAPAAGTAVSNNTTVTSGEMQRASQVPAPAQNASVMPGANGANGAAGAAPATGDAATAANATDAGAPSAPAATTQAAADAGVVRDVRGNVIDPNNPGTNPQAPPMNAGAGRFNTEAPYWSASSFQSNPEAGAGQFTTERNTPAWGLWGAYGAY